VRQTGVAMPVGFVEDHRRQTIDCGFAGGDARNFRVRSGIENPGIRGEEVSK
jgi:hypothetical protein